MKVFVSNDGTTSKQAFAMNGTPTSNGSSIERNGFTVGNGQLKEERRDGKKENVLMDRIMTGISKKLESVPDKKVLILYTGGTIGMIRAGEHGYMNKKGYLEKLMRSHRTLCDNEYTHFHSRNGFMITPPSMYNKRTHYKILEFETLYDSALMNTKISLQIMQAIEENYDKYDSFVIIHGTDTLAYTASFLSFAFENLQKTIIITGAQVPLCEVRNDASSNLLGALTLAGHFTIPEVTVFFRDRLFRGCRTTKISTDDLDTFDSPHYPPLAVFGIDLKINWDLISKFCSPNEKLTTQKVFSENIAFLKIFPLLATAYVEAVFGTEGVQAVVIESYGSGSIPKNREDIMEKIEKATEEGIHVVALTQCLKGFAHMKSDYELSKIRNERAGILSGYDMTVEACTAKLGYLLGKNLPRPEVRRLFQSNLRGELNPPEAKDPIFCVSHEDFVMSMWNTIFDVTQSTQSLKQSLTPNLLCTAAYYDYMDLIQNLSSCRADINAADYDDRTPLHIAARQGHIDIVQFMIKNGVNLNPVDKFGRCPLFEAVMARQKPMTRMLVANGAQMKMNEDLLLSTLFNIILDNDVELLGEFIHAGVNFESIKNFDGRNVAHIAAAEGKADILKLLRDEANIDFNLQDNMGHSAIDEAKNAGHDEALKVMQQRKV